MADFVSAGLSPDARFADMTLERGVNHATGETKVLLQSLLRRINGVRQEHEVFRQWCDRADILYYPSTLTKGHGADLFPEHESGTTNGRQHVSVNSPGAYVDIPASMQAVEPIENVLPTDTTVSARHAASALERIYTAWKADEDFELKFHKAVTVKGLYGRTAARVYWDPDDKKPCVEIIHQPRHLFMGYQTDAYDELEWAAYRTYYEPNALTEKFGVVITASNAQVDGSYLPVVTQSAWGEDASRPYLSMGDARIEVWDYWYRQAVWKGQTFVRMDTYNMVVAGNVVLRAPTVYKEYKGKLPYVVLFNTFIPGVPNGRPDLYDAEPLIRQKMESITAGAQMIANVTRGDAYQLVGPDAPTRVPSSGMKPVIGGVIAPGPGNRIEVISPFIAQFQLEQFLGRIDRELAVVTGLNDLLLGLAPAQVLSSSKAINALIANFESRLALRRKLLYKWRRDVWQLALDIYTLKDSTVKAVVTAGGGFLDITDPSLSPRDDMETATRALNLMNGKLWSQARAMDVVGVDDPETEQDLIRAERTDATLFPQDVQVMAQLMSALQSLGLNAPQGATQQAQAQLGSGQAALGQALGAGAVPDNAPGSQLPGDQGVTPPDAGGAVPGSPPPLVSPPAQGAQPSAQGGQTIQGMVQGGQAKGRILTQQKLGRR